MNKMKFYETPKLILILIICFGSVMNVNQAKTPDGLVGVAQLRPLIDVLDEFGERYQVFFSYEATLLEKISVEFEFKVKEPLDEAIDRLMAKTNLQYDSFNEKYFVIYEKTKRAKKDSRRVIKKFKQIEKLQQSGNFSLKQKGDVPLQQLSAIVDAVVQLKTEKTVTGLVSDTEGNPLIGATVLVKGSNIGTTTDFDGSFSLSVPDDANVLVFSYTGYETIEVQIGAQTNINVQLSIETSQLQEVVVTAFGIEREKKALSYAVQEVEGKELAAVGNTNVINSLQGKVAGLVVKQRGGAPGSRSRINIRGSRSFTGNNEPLYVVDGMPVSSGDRAIDINPSDIKSVNILKGPTAAALYGLRASNGVILIETNKGEGITGDRPSVSLEASYNFDRISMFPETQTTYGQGTGEQFEPFSAFSWGQRIDEMGTYVNQLGESEVAAVYDNDADLFETGGTLNTNLTIANAFDRGNYAINLGLADQQGILNNSAMQRMNVKLAGGYDLSNKLRVNTSINYTNNKVDIVDLPWWATFSVPPSYDLKGKPTHVPGNPFQQINFRGQHDNLYWAMENNTWVEKTSRTYGNIGLDYRPLNWLSINYRLGLDEYTNNENRVNELGSQATGGRTDPPSGGRIIGSIGEFRQVNSNFNVTLNKDFSPDINLEFLVGNEFYDIRSTTLSNQGSDIVIGGFHHISNTAVQTTTSNEFRRRVVGFFGNLSFVWRNTVYLTATGRNDIVSNMPTNNRSFFYPSVGASVVFTEFLSFAPKFFTFGKIRASVAEVGQAGPAHAVATVFRPGVANGSFTWPYQGLSAFTQSSQINSSDLAPENTRTFEIGFDLRFLGNRLGLDYTYYDATAEGQIYNVPIAGSTGFSNELRNAGEMSITGHEITLDAQPIKKTNMLWSTTINFTAYKNKVISLAEGIDQLDLGGGFRVRAIAREGEEYPSLFGLGYARDPASGEIVVDSRPTLPNGDINPRYGMPLRSTESIILGTAQPDFEVGVINKFSFKDFTLSAQIDWRQGGKLSGGYNRLGRLYGVLSETGDREADYVFPGMKGFFDDNGNIVVDGTNDIVIKRGFEFYRRNQDPIRESNIYDATFIRLRELKVSYELPKSLLANIFIRSASVYLVGRNLWLDSKLPHFDPEMFNRTEAESYNPYPQTKSYGGGILLNF